MHSQRKTTQTGNIPSPERFRAQATGIGQTVTASEYTGMARAQRVINSCDDPKEMACRQPSYPAPLVTSQESAPKRPARVSSTKPSRNSEM